MIPEKLYDGASRLLSEYIPVGDSASRSLLLVLALPFFDGVFATLLVTGAVETFSQMINVAFTIFSGAGALAVLYSESHSREHARNMVKSVVPALIIGAVAVAMVAPVFEQLFNINSLRIAAGLAVLAISGQLAGIEKADFLSVPAIMVTGLLISIRRPDSLYISLNYVMPALQTVLLASLILYIASFLESEKLNLDYVRKGGSLVLVLISASIMGVNLPSELGIMVLALSMAAGFQGR